MKNLLHFGLQRSGTNYLESILKNNYQIRMLNSKMNSDPPRQKHFRLYDDKSLIPNPKYENNLIFNSFAEYLNSLELTKQIDGVIIISKDPYSWYISYLNWSKKCNWPKVNHHYIEEYNKFYGKWMDFSKNDSRIYFVKYIDLLCNVDNELQKIVEHFNLSEKFIRKILGKKIFGINKVAHSGTFSEEKKKFYTRKKYLKQIDKSDVNEINSKLDVQLMKDLDYEIEKSA